MRILLTVHQFFPRYGSGTEVLTLTVARELTARGHEVVILAAEPAGPGLMDDQRIVEDVYQGIRVVRFLHFPETMGEQDCTTELEYRNDLVARLFASLLAQLKPDVVHVFHFARLGSRIVDAAVEHGVPVYYTATDFWTVCATSQLMLPTAAPCTGPTTHAGNCVKHMVELGFGAKWRRALDLVPDRVADLAVASATLLLGDTWPMRKEVAAVEARLGFNLMRIRSLAAILVPTAIMADVLTRNGVPANQLRRVPYGIDLQDAPMLPSLPECDPGPLRIGFIGTLSVHKGCHVAIDAVRSMAEGTASLAIYGDPSAFPEYVAQLRERVGEASSIEFRGTFEREKIFQILADVDVLVVPSIWYENAPLVMHSAMAARRPVVASRFPGMAEVIDENRNGLLFKPGDAADLRCALEGLATDRRRLANLAAGCIPPRSTTDYVDDILSIYREDRAATRGNPIPLPGVDAPARALPVSIVSGWAIAAFNQPRSLVFNVGETVVAKTSTFNQRTDVVASFETLGVRLRGGAFGFRVELPVDESVEGLSVSIEGAGSRSFRVTPSEIRRGVATPCGDGNWIAIDSWASAKRPGRTAAEA